MPEASLAQSAQALASTRRLRMNALSLNSVPASLTIWLMASILVLPMAADTLLGLVLYGWIIIELQRRSQFNIESRSVLWVSTTLLLVYLAFSLVWSDVWDWQDAVQVGLRGLLCVLFILAIAEAHATPQAFLLVLARCMAIAVLISVAVSLLLWVQAPPQDGRLEGLFRLNNAGKFGRTLAILLPLLLAGAIYEQGRWRLLQLAACAATLVALVLTDTRSAWLGAIVSITAFAVATWKPQPKAFVAAISLLGSTLLAVLLLVVFHPDPEVTRLLLPRDDSFRFLIWREHIEAIRAGSLLFGQGFFAELIVHSAETTHRGAHNMYLSTLLQGGLIALGLFLAVILVTAVRLIHRLHMPLARCCIAMLLAGLVMFVFDGDRLIDKLNIVWLVLWLPVAVAITRWPATPSAAISPTSQTPH